MRLRNIDVRLIIDEAGIKYGDIARQMRITPTWLSHLLRYPLSQKDKARILAAIKELHEERTYDVDDKPWTDEDDEEWEDEGWV